MNGFRPATVGTWVLGLVLVGILYGLFSQHFPNPAGNLGEDYQLFLPRLLDGFFWYDRNGISSVPWFTPAFCGGLPKFPNPQALYYSLPQWLTFVMSPVSAMRWTFVLCAGAGFAGSVLLLRQAFGVSRPVALLGATLFLFNGMFLARMLIGHVTFHGFMLFPLAFYFLLRRPSPTGSERHWRLLADVAYSALIFGYIVMTSGAHLLLPLIAASAGMVAIGALSVDGLRARDCALRLGLAGVACVLLCAGKLHAVASYVVEFPRELYPLPGVAGAFDLVQITLRSLFAAPPDALARTAVVNSAWLLDRHEWDYGVTFVPAALLLASLAARLRGLGYTPAWNALLKSLPILGSSSSLFRWFSVYIPLAVFGSIIALDRTELLRARRAQIAWLGGACVLALNVAADRSFYATQSYDPGPVQEAYASVRSGERAAEIDHVSVVSDAQGRAAFALGRNDALTRGGSQLLCYETLFGYRLESFPRGTLHAGPLFDETDGALNLKRPSCYVFPEANDCRPGDPFPVERLQDAQRFASYTPHAFELPASQRVANAVSLLSLACLVGAAVTCAVRRSRAGGVRS